MSDCLSSVMAVAAANANESSYLLSGYVPASGSDVTGLEHSQSLTSSGMHLVSSSPAYSAVFNQPHQLLHVQQQRSVEEEMKYMQDIYHCLLYTSDAADE